MKQSRSFGAAAGAYERGRPPYPAAAIDWLVPAGVRRILDLGAGTGKLTRLGAPFGPLEQVRMEWTHRLQPDALVDLVASRSYVITLPDRQRAHLLEGVRRLVQAHPDLRGREEVAVPYVTVAFRTRVP